MFLQNLGLQDKIQIWQDSLDFDHQLHKYHLHDQNTENVRKNTAFNLTTQNVHRFSVVSVNTSLMQQTDNAPRNDDRRKVYAYLSVSAGAC